MLSVVDVRSCALLNEQCVAKGGTVYITVGTGGANLSNPKSVSSQFSVFYFTDCSYFVSPTAAKVTTVQ